MEYIPEYSQEFIEFLNSNIFKAECFVTIASLLVWLHWRWDNFILSNLDWDWWDSNKGNQPNDDINLYYDAPVLLIKDDDLRREKFIKNVEKMIATILKDKDNDSFVFGLYGKWGEGKTSVINMLEESLEEDEDIKEKYFLIRFEPWHYENEKAITTAFLKEIENTISKEFIFPDIKNKFAKYNKLISSGLSNASIKIDLSFLDALSKDSDLHDTTDKIKNNIENTKRKFIIFIDDIDRLHHNEMLLVFKLVHLTKKLSNMIFILTLDQIVVRKHLDEILKTDPDFLDKIIQMPIDLPDIEQSVLDTYIINKIKNLLVKSKDIKDINDNNDIHEKTSFNEFINKYQTKYRYLFKTLRDAKRYINGLNARLPIAYKEVNLHDFLVLEIIRLFYPEVYKDIWSNNYIYIKKYYSNNQRGINHLSEIRKKFPAERNDSDRIVAEYFQCLINKDENSFVDLMSILNQLFPDLINNFNLEVHKAAADIYKLKKENRIASEKHFERYFLLQAMRDDISDTEFHEDLKQWSSHSAVNIIQEEIEKTIFKYHETGKRLKFFERLLNKLEYISEDVAIILIKVLYMKAEEFPRIRGGISPGNLEFDVALRLSLSLILSKAKSDGEIKQLIQEIINKTPSIIFAILMFFYEIQQRDPILPDNRKLSEIINESELSKLGEILFKRFHEHFIDSNTDIFKVYTETRDCTLILSYWSDLEVKDVDNNKILNDYIIKHVQDNHKNFITFLKGCIIEKVKGNEKEIPEKVKSIAEVYNILKFINIAQKHLEKEESLFNEEKDLIYNFLKLFDDYTKIESFIEAYCKSTVADSIIRNKIIGLGKYAGEPLIKALIDKDKSEACRARMPQLLGELNYKQAVEHLEAILKDKNNTKEFRNSVIIPLIMIGENLTLILEVLPQVFTNKPKIFNALNRFHKNWQKSDVARKAIPLLQSAGKAGMAREALNIIMKGMDEDDTSAL
jgi:predicted KAP-like P-loop ATPase